MTNLYGDILDSEAVELAMLEHLQEWMPAYIAEIWRERDPGKSFWPKGPAQIRNYTVVHAANEKWPEDQLPMLLAYSPGLKENVQYEGDGTVRAKYIVVLSAIASGNTLEATKRLARLYASAARGAIVQHESLGGIALGVEWEAEQNFPVTQGVEAERNLMAVSSTYTVEINAMNRDGGPAVPPVDPELDPGNWPAAVSTEAVVGRILDDDSWDGPEFTE